MDVTHAEGGLERDLCFPDAAEALDGRPLTVILLGAGRYPFEELQENRLTTNKAFVASKRNRPVCR